MSMIRTPPANIRQARTMTRATQNVSVAKVAQLQQKGAVRGGGRGGGKIPSSADPVSDQAQGKGGAGSERAGDNLEGEEEQQDSKSGEKVSSSPGKPLSGEGKGEGAVGKLRSSAYKPFGSSTSINMSQSSDSSDSDDSNEDTICRGGPGKGACGIEVVNGDKGVQCDRCRSWFHIKCQAIPVQAHNALVTYKCLWWFCVKCKQDITIGSGITMAKRFVESEKATNEELKSLGRKVAEVGESVREHMKVIVQSLKEQEKMVTDNSKMMEKACRDQHSQKISYADMVRGTCEKVVQDVSAKIDNLPVQKDAKQMSETTRVMTKVFDSFMDKEKRKLNVVVHNLPEQENSSMNTQAEHDLKLFTDVIKEGLSLVVRPMRTFRVGRKLDGKPRLLIVCLENPHTKAEILKMAPQLRYRKLG